MEKDYRENHSCLITQILENSNIKYNSQTLHNLLFYFENLILWNKNINLTGTKSIEDAINKHLRDTITVLPFLMGKKILDFGTGAGVPGLLIKFLYPHYSVFLLDAVRKKISFLQFIITSLKIPDINAIQCKIEKNKKNQIVMNYSPFDTIISQAVGDIYYLSSICGFYLEENGRLIIMKGKGVFDELVLYKKKLSDEGWHISIKEINLPFSDIKRYIILMTKGRNSED